MPELYHVGNIVNTHGIRGEVRVIATTDFPEERFAKDAKLVIDTTPQTNVTVESSRKHKGFTLVKFVGMDNINDVEHFKGHSLNVTKAEQQALDDGEYYYRDIIGLTVIDQHDQKLGVVSEILSPGANDVWVIPRPGKSDVLLPFIKSVVLSIDVASKIAHVDVPEGLIDDED
ncbi:ribosome maturation factor RimM [Lacticaseibacillus manihotivorans]|uniref:Ribosome maturation factor RimM n=2 Tax=Lacticaseibacillus manihotivorans TaxID=88233 RepID=A0A0R1R845_9LACO|nr:ribosome maturation factor RimM [Lacticaseibacillus manihotivorans]KRL53175.1 RimM protein, required for 16S rRNA processing [Lacticaseibacillus manihotivorans DSM 13343 = JCM 12514]QFQ91233.1 ribosome maturation factor RimM [Lacticaseibacillus manihotivorans]